jgi:hypothetical protein
VAAHQTLLSELIHGLKQPDVQTEALFTDRRWRLVRSFAPRQRWLAVLEKNFFPCSGESKLPARVDPVTDLIEIDQYADASTEGAKPIFSPFPTFCFPTFLFRV